MQSLINVVATASGGYGRNAQGGAFSRQNQMGTDHLNHLNPGGVYDGDDGREGYKTGYSTPGYRKEDETEEQLRQSWVVSLCKWFIGTILAYNGLAIVMCTANSLMTGEAKTMITTRFSEEL